MEEQPSWKNHTFTLLVFGGIVVLCAIFFTLGMLVGRTQGQRIASTTADVTKAPKDPEKDDRPELTFYDSVNKKRPPPVQALPEPKQEAQPAPQPAQPMVKAAPQAAKPVDPPPAPKPAPVANVVNFQIEALSNSAAADKLVEKLKSQGFPAFVLEPAPGDPTPRYRVQVGPAADSVEADNLKQKLKAAGYAFIPKP
jgi:cell division protein FtsN